MGTRAVPPEDANLVQLEEPCPCSTGYSRRKLEQLISGENLIPPQVAAPRGLDRWF